MKEKQATELIEVVYLATPSLCAGASPHPVLFAPGGRKAGEHGGAVSQ
jgi:hypothetical protein